MYLPIDKACEKLNITQSDILTYRAIKHIYYSEKTDKYDIGSLLEKRTMTIGLEKLISKEQKDFLLNYMADFSSLKFKLVNEIQQNKDNEEINYTNSGTNRLHRILAKKYNKKFTNTIADSAFSLAQGLTKATDTWLEKSIKNLEDKILTKRTELNEIIKEEKYNKYHRNFVKGTKKKIKYLENKLAKFQSQNYLSIHFGKNMLKETPGMTETQIVDRYRKKRLEFFVSGDTNSKGNQLIRIEYNNNGEYQLKLFKGIIQNITIPKSHEKTFTLENFNRQAMRIAYNSKGKLVLHITYSYIKPIKKEQKDKGYGTIGIDIGPKEIAVCYVKKDGNPLKYIHYSIGNLLDKRSKDTQRELSNILEEIISDAEKENFYHFTIENLKFKTYHKYRSRYLNRMLNKFPYQMFEDLMESKIKRKGLILRKINPAYTSITGIWKYSNRDNLSTSHSAKSHDLSAALTIGRRGLGFNERAVVSLRISGHNYSISIKSLLVESEKHSSKLNGITKNNSNWNLWSKLNKKYKFNELTARLNEFYHKIEQSKEVINNPINSYILAIDKSIHSNVASLRSA